MEEKTKGNMHFATSVPNQTQRHLPK